MPFRVMVFIDGENLVFRYQDMIASGAKQKPQVIHRPNVLVWHPEATKFVANQQIIRATYYTYAVGDEGLITAVRQQIRTLGFVFNLPLVANTLSPEVFKKPSQGAKAKGVDIKMTVDILTHVHQNNTDAVFLMAGDGDYVPLVQEVMRSGKQLYIAAFSKGLSPGMCQVPERKT